MRAVLLVMALAGTALLGSKKVLGRVPLLGVRLLARTGILFLLVGAYIGPDGLNLIDSTVVIQLGPVVVMGLGWIGFLYGTHLDYRLLRRFPGYLYAAGLTEALVTYAVVFGVFLALAPWFSLQPFEPASLVLAAVIATTATGTAPASLFMLRSERPIQGPNYEVMRFCSTLDDLPGVLALGLIFSFSHLGRPGPSSPMLWLLVQVALGVGFGLLFRTLADKSSDREALGLSLFGVLGLSSGLCAYLDLSPLFVSVISGLTFANLSTHREAVYKGLAQREHTFYVLFLLLSGCLWTREEAFPWLLVAGYLAARFAGKLMGAALASPMLPAQIPALWGFGMGSQGGLTVAMMVNFAWTFGPLLPPQTMTIVLSSVVLNELAAPWATVQYLRWRGET